MRAAFTFGRIGETSLKEPVQFPDGFVEVFGLDVIVLNWIQLGISNFNIAGTFFGENCIALYKESIAQLIAHEVP